MSKERVQQIREKIARKQQLSNDESLIMAEWNRQLDRAHEVEEEKRAKQHHSDIDMAAGLQDQVKQKKISAIKK
jgi:hypothetical protein